MPEKSMASDWRLYLLNDQFLVYIFACYIYIKNVLERFVKENVSTNIHHCVGLSILPEVNFLSPSPGAPAGVQPLPGLGVCHMWGKIGKEKLLMFCLKALRAGKQVSPTGPLGRDNTQDKLSILVVFRSIWWLLALNYLTYHLGQNYLSSPVTNCVV